MSFNETKTVLRVETPSLRGATMTQAYQYFRASIGEPDEVDQEDGEVLYFEYGRDKRWRAAYDYDEKRWGLEFVIDHTTDYREYFTGTQDGISLEKLNLLAERLGREAGVSSRKVRLFSYTWYNGADEPITFGGESRGD